MGRVLVVKNGKKEKVNPFLKVFNGRKKRIELLRKECVECVKALDTHLNLYHREILPKEKELVDLLARKIRVLYPYLNDKNKVSKAKRHSLKSVIQDYFETIMNIEGPDIAFDAELSQVYQTVFGSSFEEEKACEFASLKVRMEELFAQKGMKVDLSDVEMNGSQDDIMARIFESIQDQTADFELGQEEIPKAKTKKEREKEEKALAVEVLQKKEIGVIYKQLVKEFHPDLEQDPVLKLEKEELMKKLTVAYKEKDLHAILTLEIETLGVSDLEKKERSDEQLAVYNQVLQNQIETLQVELQAVSRHHRYSRLNTYPQYHWKKGTVFLGGVQKELQKKIIYHNKVMEKLSGAGALKEVEGLIREQEKLNRIKEEMGEFCFDEFDLF